MEHFSKGKLEQSGPGIPGESTGSEEGVVKPHVDNDKGGKGGVEMQTQITRYPKKGAVGSLVVCIEVLVFSASGGSLGGSGGSGSSVSHILRVAPYSYNLQGS